MDWTIARMNRCAVCFFSVYIKKFKPNLNVQTARFARMESDSIRAKLFAVLLAIFCNYFNHSLVVLVFIEPSFYTFFGLIMTLRRKVIGF